ncbi:MAG: hypothetical protein ACK4SZ_03100 [Allosphingosinicella sp.]|uniref:hypothetical protein n=1 Tax=Allosphingosinicella sp. TaxID=2823234 RepID=UPI00392CA874
MRDIVVQLIRRFVPITVPGRDWDFLATAPGGRPKRWHELEDAHRVLILADPGAGKTFEALDRARRLKARGRKAFFIRIEAIGSAFENAFEVGTREEFNAWLTSGEEAWFFLDSVDEAQLETPRALEDAIRTFGARVQPARERAHIFITSREDAWQALGDRTLIEQHLPFGAPPQDEAGAEASDEKPSSALEIFRLAGLKLDEIRLFASHYAVDDVNAFVAAIDRANLMPLAERPFDLKALIAKWKADRDLGGRLVVLRRMVDLQLAPLSAGAASVRLDPARVLGAVRALAAAVTLTGKTVICCPDGILSPDRIDPKGVLPDWPDEELDALLRAGVFDDIVYGSVRFRHREIRELLTAEWAKELVDRPAGREAVEDLFFRSVYGEAVIVPRMRPTLAWLILLDDRIRERALALEPEIATEGGDPAQLPLPVRRTILAGIVERIADEQD